MKVLLNKYPIGSLPRQKTPGRYIDGVLYKNMKELARVISKDNTILGICSSSTFEVGAGKSVFLQQMGEIWTEMINEMYGLNLEFSMKNIAFKPKDLIEKASKLPKYSFLILDEWEDSHYWSEFAISLRQFFRKCRQLNLFIMVVCPNFFQVPMSYAISRSVFFIDVRYGHGFERGFFSFYNFKAKKDLYIKGKKTQNYRVGKPNFFGTFADGYAVPKAEYLKAKRIDLDEDDKPKVDKKDITIELFNQLYKHFKGRISAKDLAEGFSITERTASVWLAKDKGGLSEDLGRK